MTEQEIIMGIRVDALNYILENEKKTGKERKGTSTETIAEEIKVPLNILVNSLKRLHEGMLENDQYVWPLFDGNCEKLEDGTVIPRAYWKSRRTQEFLNKPF